jgi:putative ABC transport system permease protein
MMPDMATGTAADLPDGLEDELRTIPHIAPNGIDGVAFVEGRVIAKTPAGEEDAVTAICVARQYLDPGPPPFDLIEGDPRRLRDELCAGQVVVGSVLAQRLNLRQGDTLQLETVEGRKPLPIAGIANEYMVGGMAIHMQRDWAVKYLGVEGFDGFIVKAAQPAYLDELKSQLQALTRKYDVLLHSYTDISRNISRMVGGVEWSLWALVLMGFVVAAFGVVNTLTMNVLEQTRELGLLRIVAMTKSQVRRTIVTQALIIGGVGLPPGIALGVLNAFVMNLMMMQSFGHPIDFHLYPDLLAVTLCGSLLIVLVAAIIPAYRATQIDVVEALHYE